MPDVIHVGDGAHDGGPLLLNEPVAAAVARHVNVAGHRMDVPLQFASPVHGVQRP